jgi:hypothetical protein
MAALFCWNEEETEKRRKKIVRDRQNTGTK